jgi:hypothetical protein
LTGISVETQYFYESSMLEDNNRATRDRNSEKDRQYNGQKKQNKTTSYGRFKTTQKTKDGKIRTPPNTEGKVICCGRASGHHRVTPATSQVISYE